MRSARRILAKANLPGLLFVLLVVVATEVAVTLLDYEHTVPRPSSTLRALRDELSSGELSGELATTLERYAHGLAFGIVIGVALGVVVGSSRKLRDATSVTFEFLRPIPAIALIPAAVLVFGIGLPMYRFVVAYAVVWPIFVNTMYGVRGADPVLHDVARTSGVGRSGLLVRVTLPAALPSIATGIRLGASVALVVVITAEYVKGTDGVGWYMQQQHVARQLEELYAAVLLAALVGYLVNAALRAVERRVVFWAGEERLVR